MCTGAEILMLTGMGITGGAQLAGANAQNRANRANTNAANQRFNQLSGMVNQYLTPPSAQDPYANAMMQFLGVMPQQQSLGNLHSPQQQPSLSPTPTQQAQGEGFAAYDGPMMNAQSGAPVPGQQSNNPLDRILNSPLMRNLQPRQAVGYRLNPAIAGETAEYNPNILTESLGMNSPMQFGMGDARMRDYTPQDAFTYTPAIATGTQGQNAGQDALLQMMRREYTAPNDAELSQQISRMAGGQSQFDNTDLFQALQTQDMRNLNQQVAALQGSAGSLGQRFGTAMNFNEGQLRQGALADMGVRNAQIAQGSFENAQNRAMQAMGLGAQREQFQGQFGLSAAGLQQQAAMAAQQGGLDQNRLAQELALANAGFQNQAGQFNAQMGQQMSSQNAQQNNIYNNLMLQALAQAGSMQQGSRQQNMNLLSLLAGLPMGQQQPSAWPGAFNNIGQLAMMFPMFQELMRPDAQPQREQ